MSKTFHLASLPPGTSTCGKVYSLGTLLSFPASWPVNSLSIKGHSASLYGVVRSCTVVHKAPNAQLPPALFSSLMVSSCGCRLYPASLASFLFLEYVDSVLPWGLCSKALPSEVARPAPSSPTCLYSNVIISVTTLWKTVAPVL